MKTTIERFTEKIEMVPDSGCWIWMAGTFRSSTNIWSDEYGCFYFDGKTYSAHRASYSIFIGKIPEGLSVCHRCDTPLCVNPSHLFLGTTFDNMQDMKRKGRQAKFTKSMFKKGELHPQSKINNSIADVIRNSAGSIREIAKQLGVTRTIVHDVKSGKRWSITGSTGSKAQRITAATQ